MHNSLKVGKFSVGVSVNDVTKEAEKNKKKQGKMSCHEPIATVLWEDIIRDTYALWKLRQCLDFSE